MNARRRDTWAQIERVLKECPTWGVVYIAVEGKPVRSGYSIPWPAAEKERPARTEQILEILQVCGDRHRVYFSEQANDLVPSHSWPWPGPAGLFDESEGEHSSEEEIQAQEADAPTTPSPVMEVVRVESEPEVQVEFQRVSLTDLRRQLEEAEEAPSYSQRCADDILAVLGMTDRRLSTSQLCEELARCGREWSYSTVSSVAPAMRRDGKLTNERDTRGKGYGLPQWSEEHETQQQE